MCDSENKQAKKHSKISNDKTMEGASHQQILDKFPVILNLDSENGTIRYGERCEPGRWSNKKLD